MLSILLKRRQRRDPVPVYLALMLGQAICFSLFFTVHLDYQVTVVGLDPFQLVLVGTVLEVTCFLFEVPTGIVADVYSRRRSILIGVALIGCAYVLEGAIPDLLGRAWGPGLLGARLHVHQRRHRGLDHRRDRRAGGRTDLPPRRADVAGRWPGRHAAQRGARPHPHPNCRWSSSGSAWRRSPGRWCCSCRSAICVPRRSTSAPPSVGC